MDFNYIDPIQMMAPESPHYNPGAFGVGPAPGSERFGGLDPNYRVYTYDEFFRDQAVRGGSVYGSTPWKPATSIRASGSPMVSNLSDIFTGAGSSNLIVLLILGGVLIWALA